MIQSAGIVLHRSRKEALELAHSLIEWLEQRSIAVMLLPEAAERLVRLDLAVDAESMRRSNMIISLGGDGTILTAARMASGSDIPILGVHLGRFGFIAEVHPDELFLAMENILAGKYLVEERLMVCGEIYRKGICLHSGIGLNEVVVKSGKSQLLRLNTSLGGVPFATYYADGLIISTPTGSTGYALSAGGPLIAPSLQALLVAPICPHTLSARPIVVPCEEVIDIEIESDGEEVIFDIDSVDSFSLMDGDKVTVHRAQHNTHLIVLDGTSFYQKVRARYLYGERLNG